MIKSAILLNIDYAEYDAKRAEFVKCQTDYKSLVDQFPNVSKTVKEKLSILVSLAELPRPRTLVNDYYNRLCNGEHPDFLNSFTTGYSDEVQKLFLKHYNLIEQKKQHKIKLGKIREELNILMKEILRLQAEERKREEEENEAFRQRCFDILCIILILIFLYILYMRFSILQNPFSDFVLYYKAFCTYYLELFYYY